MTDHQDLIKRLRYLAPQGSRTFKKAMLEAADALAVLQRERDRLSTINDGLISADFLAAVEQKTEIERLRKEIVLLRAMANVGEDV
jgi:hypothetical protein